MSFITKRERVFNEYMAPVDLPPRNEGKLKAYSSCTDARAWSHFHSDKTEHLIELIKRNNAICPGKYVPINVIIEMMMAAKNAEIARLKRKIAQLEQMLEAYDQLDLSCEQKCEISTAHAMIRAATKSLDALPPLELDISNFTEGAIDSEGFQTGKSGGDDATNRQKKVEWIPSTGRSDKDTSALGMESKGFGPYGFDPLGYEGLGGISARGSRASKINQSDITDRCACDASTSAHDTRVDELEESLISKDAKLNAMQNTIAVMENDVCEPYCIYAHVFTALEKIYGTLRQNEKYRLFLDLMSTGKDTRCLDIKGKILFKLKILEKFSIALISPCSERFKYDETCECYAAQVETSFALTQSDQQTTKSKVMPSDVMRTQLIADIMENNDMKEIITKDNPNQQATSEDRTFDVLFADNYSIDTENLNRIKALQADYEDLMNAYENVKFERDTLKARCQNYESLNKELEDCRSKLREYNMLYNERDYYRKRSEELDSLKEQVLVLADETSSLEIQLKAENEINSMKAGTIDDLRRDNIALEKKLNELTIAYEKEKNAVLCKLKEADCKIMCQEQQIKSLSNQIDRIIEQDHDKQPDGVYKSATIIDEIEALRDQIKSLNNALYANEDEKQQLQDQFEDKLKLINELRMEIEEWKSTCEKTLQRNDYLENYIESFRDEVRRLVEENSSLSQEVEEKTTAVANLINIINNKSQEVNKLMNDINLNKEENRALVKQLQDIKNTYGSSVKDLENEKKEVMESLQLARQESKELLEKVKDYDDVLHKKEDMLKILATESENCNELRNMLAIAIEDNKKLQKDLNSQENNNSILLQEIQRLREVNSYATDNINSLQNDKEQYRTSYELIKKESEILEDKLKQFDELREQLQNLRLSHDRLLNEKHKLVTDLESKAKDLDDAKHSIELTRRESEHLLEKVQHSESLKEDMIKLNKDHQKLVNEKQVLQKDLTDKNKEIDDLLHTLSELKAKNDALLEKTKNTDDLEKELLESKKAYNDLLNEKAVLQNDFDNKTQEINNLYNTLEEKIVENKDLSEQIKTLENHHMENMSKLQDVNLTTQSTLNSLRRESEELLNKLKNYETLLNKYEDLKQVNNKMKQENEKLQTDLENRHKELEAIKQEKDELEKQVREILTHTDNLEKALMDARQELIQTTSQSPLDDVMREIEEMKKDKLNNNRKIKELLDKLDESDNIICNLSEDVLARDDKIAVLENHINSLEDEMRQLHDCLAEVVSTGEQIKDNSVKKIDQTLNKMEAHHSKATHNMKMELAKLHNANAKLEEQLSVHKIKSRESFKDQHKYVTQIIHLQNEREIIATEIKQLELNCVGDSNLSPTSCGVEEIVKSLDKIRKCIDARNTKSTCLEQTLQKVQNSSQLLLSKADEAKKLVEKEKQKIINEKEEAIADRLNMERQLLNLKVQLEEQSAHDKKIIKDLEGEILNQKLIIDKLNESTQNYIAKLEDEIHSFQNLYQNSIAKIGELEEKLKKMTEENDKNVNILDKVNADLSKKSRQVSSLQKSLEELKNKPVRDIDVQVGNLNNNKNTKTQTDKSLPSNVDDELGVEDIKDDENVQDINTIQVNKSTKNKSSPENKPISQLLNEVQILTANVEPPTEFVKSYVDYKKKRLSPGKIEQFSISTETGDNLSDNPHLVDIYRQSDAHPVSSKSIKTDGEIASTSMEHHPKKLLRHVGASGLNKPLDLNTKYTKESTYSKPGTSSDKDLFLIYQDSESNHADNSSFKEKGINNSHQQEILVERMQPYLESQVDAPFRSGQQTRNHKEDRKEGNKPDYSESPLKQPLEINLPRILTDDTSYETVTDVSSKRLETRSKGTKSQQNPEPIKSDDSHDLSRVDADFILFKDKADQIKGKKKRHKQPSNDFGLEYILDSVQHEIIHPERMSDINKRLHKSLSDDIHSHLKGDSKNILLTSSPDRKSNSKWSDFSQPKLVAEQGVMVNIDATEYYENKIRHLSQQLEFTEKDYKKKMDAIKAQYDNNIKGIINEHNQGVKSIQSLHEETLQDVIKIHENEVENLRTMSIDAMRKADRLERENVILKSKMQGCSCGCITLDEGPTKNSTSEMKKRRSRHRDDTMMLTKTNIEAFNVKPRLRVHGPCTCSLDVNVSDTIRNIFEQVDVEQRKLAEHAYLKYIANKIMTVNVESLDVHELSFLHLKVCRTWKSKLGREEALQKRIDSLECELLNKKRCTQQHIAELDRRVAEERRRLQEAREAVCRCSPDRTESQTSTNLPNRLVQELDTTPINPPNTEVLQTTCSYNDFVVNERRSAGDLLAGMSNSTGPIKLKSNKPKPESRATLAKLDVEERRMKKMYDEPPTRLRRSHERPSRASKK